MSLGYFDLCREIFSSCTGFARPVEGSLCSAVGVDHPVRAKEEDKLSQKALVFSEPDGIKRFVGELIRALVIKARLPHGGDDYPIAAKIDGVTIPLVDSGHPPASIRPVERVLWSLSLKSNNELPTICPKPPN